MSEGGPFVCLLPVRNGAEDLPGYLDSVATFADAVVALDDGSTDGTRELLAASPLVEILLTNPARESYRGWDDGANRSRLLEAAAELEPAWILSLDADERFAPDEAAALRTFVDTQALPGFAFGFTVFRMWEDLEHYEPAGYWVYRLFAFEPGQRFADQRLHFDPTPTSIPRSRMLRTTLRIQHLAGLTPQRRAARIEKYEQADPDRVSTYRYPDLAGTAPEVQVWQAWTPDLPFLVPAGPAAGGDVAPALSAVVISRDDEDRIARTVSSVVSQDCEWPFEVIVVTSGSDRTAAIVREQFPEVTLLELPSPALPGEARNAGLRVARGDYVSFPGSHVELPQGSLAARIRAHDLGYAMVTGTTLNGTKTPAGWASYFLDHSSVLPGRPSTKLLGPPAHCSYLREALLDVGGFPEGMRAGEDTVVNNTLASMGYEAYRAQDVTLVHHNPCRTRRRLLRHYFVRGRGYGRILLDRYRYEGRLLRQRPLRSLFQLQVRQRVSGTGRSVEAWGGVELRRRYRPVRRLIVAATIAYWLGTCFELLRPGPARAFVLWGRPVVTLRSEDAETTLIRVDVVTKRVKALRGPRDLLAEIEVQGAVGKEFLSGFGRRGPARLRAASRCFAAVDAGFGVRLVLAWACLRIRTDDVHTIALAVRENDSDEPGEVVQRCLDTRSRAERTPPVRLPPPGSVPVEAGA